MKPNIVYVLSFLFLSTTLAAQPVMVIDKKAIAKSGENLAVNLAKGEEYQQIRDHTEEIHIQYFAIEALQQQVREELKQAETVRDLQWADLSKSLYLANELIKGSVQPGHARPGLEIDFVIEHPLFQQHPLQTYRDLFIADAASPLPADLASFRIAQQTARDLTNRFQWLSAERKAYGAVAFQYLAEDLMVKATEMNELLKQHQRFSMTEAERMRLQFYTEEYLVLSGELLERSDQLLLDIGQVSALQEIADHTHLQLERTAAAQTLLFNY